MEPVPIFTCDELAAAFRLVLPPDVAERCARQWFDQFASESMDQRGTFLYKEWWDQPGAPRGLAEGLVVQTGSFTETERDGHERKVLGSMTVADRINLLMRFSDFHLNLVALVSEDVKRRVQVALGASDAQMERRLTQMRRIVKAFSAPSTGGAP
jgi:hypothetical protein